MKSSANLPPPVAPAPLALCIDFGGMAVRIDSENNDWLHKARSRYGCFAVERSPELNISYRVNDNREPTPIFLQAARQQPIHPKAANGQQRLEGVAFTAELDSSAGQVMVEGPLATYPVDRLLPALWYERVERGLIVHAAALAEEERGWLCCGPSGSGKSTLAGQFPHAALCDELVAVTIDGEAARLTGLPFWSGRPDDVTLEGIYLLRHGRENSRRALSASDAFSRMQPEINWPTYDSDALLRAFDTLAELVKRVPVWDLSFRPGPAVWSLITSGAEE